MAVYDSAYLLKLFDRFTGRPATDAVTDASKYERLTDAQAEIVADIAVIYPACLYPTMTPTLSTSDNKTFTFGTDDNGYAIAPMGKASIYASLDDVPTNPWRPGLDYIPLGGTSIQIPNNNTYSGTLYWRGITPPGVIDGSGDNEPVLFPEASRRLIAYRAAISFLEEGGRQLDLAAFYAAKYGHPLSQNPGLFASWMLEWRTQWANGGVIGNRLTGLAVATGSLTNASGF